MEEIRSFLLTTEGKLVLTILIFAISYLLKRILNNKVTVKIKNLKKRYIIRQVINYILFMIIAALILIIWDRLFGQILTMISFVAAALIIISKEIILNFLSNGIIIWRGLFQVGDRVAIGDITGDILETGPLFISLAEIGKWVGGDDVTGRIVKVPNMNIITQPVFNFSRGHDLIWNELTIELDIKSDIDKAQRLAVGIAEKYSFDFTDDVIRDIEKRSEEFLFVKKKPSIYVKSHDKKILLTIRYACKFHKRRQTENDIWTDLLKACIADDEIHLNGEI